MFTTDNKTGTVSRIMSAVVKLWLAMSGLGFLLLGFRFVWLVLVVGNLHWNWLFIAVLPLAIGACFWWVLFSRY